jgi:hypothetical protein
MTNTAAEKAAITAEIKKGMALAFFACAYADQAEECGQPLSGQIMDQLPPVIDPSAVHAANTLVMDMVNRNQEVHGNAIKPLGSIDQIFFMAVAIQPDDDKGHIELTPENFGHYCAMQAMGTGVGLESFGYDVHEKIQVPGVLFDSGCLQKDYFEPYDDRVRYGLSPSEVYGDGE